MASAIVGGGVLGLFYLAAVLTWLLSEIVGLWILPARRRASRHETARADRGSGFVIFLGIVVALVTVSVFANLGLATFSLGILYVGVALMFVGIGVRQWAIAVLGKFFTATVRSMEGQYVVNRGPYRWVRHPSYTGAILTLIGLGLAGGSWEGMVGVLVIAALVYGYRIHVEEQFLIRELGNDYITYRKRTKRIIPFIL